VICDLQNVAARTGFWETLRTLGAIEVRDKHWSDVGVEHRTFRLGSEEFTVCEDYGELLVHGSPEILQRFRVIQAN